MYCVIIIVKPINHEDTGAHDASLDSVHIMFM